MNSFELGLDMSRTSTRNDRLTNNKARSKRRAAVKTHLFKYQPASKALENDLKKVLQESLLEDQQQDLLSIRRKSLSGKQLIISSGSSNSSDLSEASNLTSSSNESVELFSISSEHHKRSCLSSARSYRFEVGQHHRRSTSDYSSASPSCISTLDYWHLCSSPDSLSGDSFSQAPAAIKLSDQPTRPPSEKIIQQQQDHRFSSEESKVHDEHQLRPAGTTNNPLDPVYLEDEQVLRNLILREEQEGSSSSGEQVELPALSGQARHSLLSWMLKVCEHQQCQDEIFPLATQILDRFLLLQPSIETQIELEMEEAAAAAAASTLSSEANELSCQERLDELNRRQLYLFAACALLLATKLRQTPRLCVQTLMEFSGHELPFELSREEILEAELLLLAGLKWDLASLVTPNDFLVLLVRRCNKLLQETGVEKRCDESRVRRHAQTLVELCLMGKFGVF